MNWFQQMSSIKFDEISNGKEAESLFHQFRRVGVASAVLRFYTYYNTILAAKWSSSGRQSFGFKVTGSRSQRSVCSSLPYTFPFLRHRRYFLSLTNATKLGIKDLLKDQQW